MFFCLQQLVAFGIRRLHFPAILSGNLESQRQKNGRQKDEGTACNE
jgi:hypothetical protein